AGRQAAAVEGLRRRRGGRRPAPGGARPHGRLRPGARPRGAHAGGRQARPRGPLAPPLAPGEPARGQRRGAPAAADRAAGPRAARGQAGPRARRGPSDEGGGRGCPYCRPHERSARPASCWTACGRTSSATPSARV
ncbi:MAG: hypothetical protein AVDCRST_MAG13-1485, partial [uncultured Solirubrobacteraceae bacterium]